ncbi:hypothetical protein [Streptosporangium saharense]|uniref:hypothetical protein n=1 Tax=Streptosporangium saharense TaxID=1706840 RepID=UPI003322BA77
MNASLNRLRNAGKITTTVIVQPGEPQSVRDAYDAMLAADPHCEHGKRVGICRTCTKGGTQ